MLPHRDHQSGYTILQGVTKALCMDNPIQELIIGNVPGALGVENCPLENECYKQDANGTETMQVNNEVDENKMNDNKEQSETQPSTHTHTHTQTNTQMILYLSNAMNCIGQTKRLQ